MYLESDVNNYPKAKTEFLDENGRRVPYDAVGNSPDVYNSEVFTLLGSSKIFYVNDRKCEEDEERFFFKRTG